MESANPPAFLVLGTDALTNYRRIAQARLDSTRNWEELSTSTDLTGELSGQPGA